MIMAVAAEKRCKVCGKPIEYGVNGAQMFDTCFECYKPYYPCSVSKVRQYLNWDEFDALEDRCLGNYLD